MVGLALVGLGWTSLRPHRHDVNINAVHEIRVHDVARVETHVFMLGKLIFSALDVLGAYGG
jgi:hypothetical protein